VLGVFGLGGVIYLILYMTRLPLTEVNGNGFFLK